MVPNLNGERWIVPLCESLSTAIGGLGSDDVEVILVDDCSTDTSVATFQEFSAHHKNFRLLQNPRNIGWSGAVNRGVAASLGDPILVFSNDMLVDPASIRTMVNVFRTTPSIALAQFNSRSLLNPTDQDSGMNYLDRFGYAYSRLPTSGIGDVFFAEGMAFAMRRSLIGSVGLLDDSYFMEYDDMDYSWRVQLMGYRVVFIPDAVVFHARGGTVGRTYFNRRLQNIESYTRNHILTLGKNYALGNALISVGVVGAVELAKSALLAIRGSGSIARANVKGLFSGIAMLPNRSAERRRVQVTRTIDDKRILRRMHPFDPLELVAFLQHQAVDARHFVPLQDRR